MGPVEKDLGEVVLAVLCSDRSHVDAWLIEVNEHHGQAPVSRTPGAGEQHGAVGEVPVGGPDLLPGEPPSLTIGFHARAERRQVTARVRLGKGLRPVLLTTQEGGEIAVRQVRRVDQEDGHEDLEGVEALGDGDVVIPQRVEHRGAESGVASEPATRLGPTEPGPALVEQEALQIGQMRCARLETFRSIPREPGDPGILVEPGREGLGVGAGGGEITAKSHVDLRRAAVTPTVGSCSLPDSMSIGGSLLSAAAGAYPASSVLSCYEVTTSWTPMCAATKPAMWSSASSSDAG